MQRRKHIFPTLSHIISEIRFCSKNDGVSSGIKNPHAAAATRRFDELDFSLCGLQFGAKESVNIRPAKAAKTRFIYAREVGVFATFFLPSAPRANHDSDKKWRLYFYI